MLRRKRQIFIAIATTTLLLTVAVCLRLFPAPLSDSHAPTKVKTTEEYWAETGLTAEALETLLDATSCQHTEREFLACANAVVSIAQKYSVTILPTGEVTEGLDAKSRQIFAEKDMLVPWQNLIAGKSQLPAIPFVKIWKTLSEKYIPAGHQTYAIGLGINGFLSVAQDPHTYILPGDYYTEVVARATHRSVSIGLVMGRDDKNYYVKKILDQSPAELAGLKKGDILTEINGKSAKMLSPFNVSHELKGEAGTTLELKIVRDQKAQTITIVRSERNIQTVSSHVLEGIKPVGVLTINKFAAGTCDGVKAALESLAVQGVSGLLLDLRDNPGGQMSEAACVTGLFLGPGKRVFEIKLLGSNTSDEVTYTEQDQKFAGPMAILINSGTASAAEILAGALKDHRRGILVGERTFGKGSFQEGIIWSKNSKIAFFQTKGFYFLPSGKTPQLVGLEPDVKVSFKDKFALRESEQFLYPLQPMVSSVAALSEDEKIADGMVAADDIVSCMSFESDFVAPEDPEIREAHRVLNCRTIAKRGEQ